VKAAERWFSDRLHREITLVRWGNYGAPVLIFPTAGGDAEEIERFGLVDACGKISTRWTAWRGRT
jgi:esterase/lipase superfamily enzyme